MKRGEKKGRWKKWKGDKRAKESDEEARERRWKKRRRAKEERREGPPLSADKRQKWMNPIGRQASSSLLSPRLHELRTHFIEICEIRKAGYRVIYHWATPAHTSSRLHNKKPQLTLTYFLVSYQLYTAAATKQLWCVCSLLFSRSKLTLERWILLLRSFRCRRVQRYLFRENSSCN